MKKTGQIPDLSSIKKKLKEEESKSEEDDNNLIEERRDFSEEDFHRQWKAFAIKLRNEGKESDYNALNSELILEEKEKPKLILANKFQQVAVENLKQDLLTHLRTSLKNSYIDLIIEIKKIEEKELRYTNKEKFDFLADKYPMLKKLKDKLDLDPDF